MREPEGVLGRIVADKRQQVAARRAALPFEAVRRRAAPTRRSFKAALARPGARFVLEVKRASPSKGALRPDLDTKAVARAYRGVADAVSVLTDGPYFGGSFEDLAAVRRETEAPVLCKDFVLSPYQVAEARMHGADATLLMLSVLDDAEALACLEEAQRLGMDCLVEVHTREELERALRLPAEVIGINNRDLRTLKIDLEVTERLAPLVPPGRTVVSESGIETRADVQRLAQVADAFLVGSSLMQQPDIGQAARALVFGRAKVCGLTRAEDVAAAREAGAAFGGLIFVEESLRALGIPQAEALANAADGLGLVGVFRDAPAEAVAETAERLGLKAVQLHGAEDVAYIARLRRRLPEGVEVWSVSGVADAVHPAAEGADRTVFDTSRGGRSGGTGEAFDWEKVRGRPELRSGLLAGGLNTGNVAAAQALGPWAVDVSSGVEAAPGVKDSAKLEALFAAMRGPAREKETA
ncbi:MAG TPA: bifunctional indole-3-glycerol-phosphate synthase TrpC/phosphoribosylanthranilate isomerase TrpF [Caulobacteraceae bacterium]|jgi:indole-3-glycerol phosphate synthase/phosphoribosylanthranilate isomerase